MKAAWCVVLTSTSYTKGIITLKYSLHNVCNSQYPLLVLYTSAVTPDVIDVLRTMGCIMRKIDAIKPLVQVKYTAERFTETWTKLAVWKQQGYDRLVMMDADMLPLQNMDELMDLELNDENWVAAAHACVCNPQKIQHYPPTWTPTNCSYTNLDASACVDPKPAQDKTGYFNSGLVVLTPSIKRFNAMIEHLYRITDFSIYPFPDQDFLNEVFKNQWKSIPYTYNALKTLQWAHAPMWDIKQVKNIHFILSKPWDIAIDHELSDLENIYRPLYELWWRAYDESIKSLDMHLF
ncbi:nucleotide-diphospho-sugar transferase [Mycotypha africana]|uniref:nucleotide-diphospho-sugar transferase n=1 Tax=Mycotypha africana TaxID=64632 RepID=UPI002301EAEF|nr:nucleotide-diphospho-sugar transferase [Mycotypha africana]KAI8968887.1 nucleotide-diphospho-sugar transferase [Mycotypha africana]